MKIKVQTTIRASREEIWKTITDIENAPSRISGIEKVEILEKPESGIVGLKWSETRIMFGKAATEVMWITKAKENEYYHTRAENHGAIYETKLELTGMGDAVQLSMDFGATTPGMIATFFANFMGPLVKKSMIKAVRQDLEDIKKSVEK